MIFIRARLAFAGLLVLVATLSPVHPANAATINGLTGRPRLASDATWDQVAQCESGGHWGDTRGGYQGGVHFDPWSWDREIWWLRKEGHDVSRIARDANLATRRRQIDMADDWLRRTSWEASWPVCRREARG